MLMNGYCKRLIPATGYKQTIAVRGILVLYS